MSMSAAELYEAGLALPPAAGKDVAMRLLDSLEAADRETIDAAWTAEVSARVDGLLSGTVVTVSGRQVFTELASRRGSRHA